jgi:hypothetical protein
LEAMKAFAYKYCPAGLLVFACLAVGTWGVHFSRSRAASLHATLPTPARLNYGQLPLRFEANQGQTAASVRFLARGNGYALFLTETEAVLKLRGTERGRPLDEPASPPSTVVSRPPHSALLRMRLVGANSKIRTQGLDQLPGQTNYFIGNEPRAWRGGVAGFARVKQEQVYPGIDLVWYGNQQQLEHDFLVAPGAQPQRIRW